MHRFLIVLSLALTGAVATASEPSPAGGEAPTADEPTAQTVVDGDTTNGDLVQSVADGDPDAEGDEGSGAFVDLTDDTVLSADPTRPQVEIYLPVTRRRHGPLFPSAIDGAAPRPPAPR